MILKYPDPVLSKKAKRVKKYTEKLSRTIDKMIMEMLRNSGIGLAAPQIGELVRVIIASNPETGEPFDYILVNPEIIESIGSVVSQEGCLSIPNAVVEVQRSKKIMVKAQDKFLGSETIFEADDILSVIIQHEIDHLNGITLIDHIKEKKN